ncbi:MAG: hypothetical protein ACE3L7_05385 [Candidatus Pristimantibacillus sp.]
MDIGYSGSSSEKQVILMGVGNKSRLADIRVEDVFVNNNSLPSNVKIQVSNPLKGFIISSNFEGEEEKKYNFQDLKSVSIQTKTERQKQFDKLSNGTATEKDTIYAISIGHHETIQKVRIKYRFLGLTFNKVIQI